MISLYFCQQKSIKLKKQSHEEKKHQPLVLFLCCLFSDEDEGEGEDQEENDDGHDCEDSYI